MKTGYLFILLLFPLVGFSQTAKELFLQIPEEKILTSKENREKLILENKGDFLKFRLSEARRGEVKIVNQKKDEILLGMTFSNCEGNVLQFWRIKKGVWKDATKEVVKPLGKEDIAAILRASPVAISKLDQELGIAMFYEFSESSNNLRLIVRKQDSCEVAGTVYEYKFNGKKFEIKK